MTMTEKYAMAEKQAEEMRKQLAKIGATEIEIAQLDAFIKKMYEQRDKLARRLQRENRELRKKQKSLREIGEIDEIEILIENMTA